jgi:hypothetical protein
MCPSVVKDYQRWQEYMQAIDPTADVSVNAFFRWIEQMELTSIEEDAA